MRKLVKSDILKKSGSFKVLGVDGKTYKFNVVAVFEDDSKAFAWCIAKPNIKYPDSIDKESAVLFRVAKNPQNESEELVELVTDNKVIDKVFKVYNDYADVENNKADAKKSKKA